jgi:hypothetical protein
MLGDFKVKVKIDFPCKMSPTSAFRHRWQLIIAVVPSYVLYPLNDIFFNYRADKKANNYTFDSGLKFYLTKPNITLFQMKSLFTMYGTRRRCFIRPFGVIFLSNVSMHGWKIYHFH